MKNRVLGVGCWVLGVAMPSVLFSVPASGNRALAAAFRKIGSPSAQGQDGACHPTPNAQRPTPACEQTPNTQHPTPNTLPAPESEDIVVTGEGMAAFNGDVAAAQEEAVWDAKRNAVEQAVGLFLKAKTTGANFGIEEDEIQGRTQGFVRKWEIVEGSRRIETVTTGGSGTARLLHIQVRATVGLLPLIHRLADIADVYKDLERPRLRVSIMGKTGYVAAAAQLQQALAGALQAQGFEVVAAGAAEVMLTGTLDVVPTVRFGDKSTPYGIGESVAACRARLTLQAVSTAGEDVLFARKAEATGRSFQSDGEATADATTQLAETAIADSDTQFVPHLLARWARERQEGHVIVVRADGLTAAECERLQQTLADMRGFRRFVDVQRDAHRLTLRFLTRRDTHSLRRDLAAFPLPRIRHSDHSAHSERARASGPNPAARSLTQPALNTHLNTKPIASPPAFDCLQVLNERGPVILCAAPQQ